MDFFLNLPGDGAVGLVNAGAEAAVAFADGAVFQLHRHHAALIQLAAVAGEKQLFSYVTPPPRRRSPGVLGSGSRW